VDGLASCVTLGSAKETATTMEPVSMALAFVTSSGVAPAAKSLSAKTSVPSKATAPPKAVSATKATEVTTVLSAM